MDKFNNILVSIFSVCMLTACQQNHTIDSIIKNNKSLAKIYDEYKTDRQKRKSLHYLVLNSRCRDINLLHLDSLKMNVDIAHKRWQNSNWATLYNHSVFEEYILPMSIADEPLEYYWRDDITKHIKLPDTMRAINEAAKYINHQIIINTSEASYGNNQMGYTQTMKGKYGKCDDRAILTTMALRAYSIPAAYDYIPYWGSVNNGHSVCSAIMPSDSLLVFQSHNDGEDVFMVQKTPKVYRKMFSVQNKELLHKYKDKEFIPPLFADFKFKDVTEKHSIGMSDVKIKTEDRPHSKIVYLSVFSPKQWMPIAYAIRNSADVTFRDVGTGVDQYERNPVKGDNIGEGIIYLPCCYTNTNMIAVANPFILSKSGYEEIVCDSESLESVVLTRKYPLLNRIKGYAKQMSRGVFEVANDPDFSDSHIIHNVKRVPMSQLQRVDIDLDGKYKYIRYRKPRGTFNIAELKVYDKSGNELVGELVAPEELLVDDDIKKVVDGDPLTYYSLQGAFDAWVGIELSKSSDIGYIEYAPRNDDNAVSSGDIYELFYWNNEWISLGQKQATAPEIKFHNVPKGALLWLRNNTRGREERPFTYKDGVQTWW